MRLVTYDRNGVFQPAILRGPEVVDLTTVRSVLELIAMGPPGRRIADEALDAPASAQLDDVRLLAPIPHPQRFVMATGWNYREHFEESLHERGGRAEDLPAVPTFFAKAGTTLAGPYDPIPYDGKLTDRLDFEAEIAVVIGRGGRSIPTGQAAAHIYGYMLANDVTARDIQRRHGGQWFKGKSIDGSCPTGPWLTTVDELPAGEPIDLRCTVNGEILQEATSDLMIFPIPEIVARLSEATTLRAGDIVLTGTPKGVGYARTPPRYLVPGDEVIVSSSRLGELRNRVREEVLTAYRACAETDNVHS